MMHAEDLVSPKIINIWLKTDNLEWYGWFFFELKEEENQGAWYLCKPKVFQFIPPSPPPKKNTTRNLMACVDVG